MGSVTKFIQNSLNGGEITSRLTARDDYDRYKNSVGLMRNFYPLPQGGTRSRHGTIWVAQTRDAAKAYIFPFEFGATTAYVVEAGALYFRFFKNQGRLGDLSGVVGNATNNGSGLIRINDTAHGLSTNHYVSITGVKGTVEANGEWKVTVIDADNFDLQGSAFVNAYTSGGVWVRPYEIVSPYALADIPSIRSAQSADVMYLANQSYAPRKLTRTGDTAWTITEIDFIDGPYMDMNEDSTKTLTVSANTGTGRTMTATGFSPFVANHVGSLWRIKGNTTWGYVKVTAFTDSTHVTVDVKQTLDFVTPGTSQTANWREGSWSTHRGFPAAVTIFEQRTCWASTPTEQQTVWLSTAGSFEDLSPSAVDGTVAASDGITYKLGSNKVNIARWLAGARDLIIGTVGEEFSMTGGTSGLTPTTPPLVRSGTQHGSSDIQGIRISNSIYFVQRSGKKLRSHNFSFNEDTYASPDVSITAEHLFRTNKITHTVYQQEPDSILWAVRADGRLISFTVYEIEQVRGWAQHGTDGTYHWLAVIPTPSVDADNLWQVVARTVGGSAKYFIEYNDPLVDMDSALIYNGIQATATITPGATTGNGVTFTASASIFTSADVGKEIILLAYVFGGATWYSRATIKTFVGGTSVTADITAAFPSTDAVPANSWGLGITAVTNLQHLNGKTVAVVGDDAVYDSQVVSGGSVTLKYGESTGPAAVTIYVGLAFTPTARIETLQPAYRDDNGIVRNKWKHWATIDLDLEETMGLTINGTIDLQFRKPSDPMDVGPPLFTGTKTVAALGARKTGILSFEQKQPLPATIHAYAGELEVGD